MAGKDGVRLGRRSPRGDMFEMKADSVHCPAHDAGPEIEVIAVARDHPHCDSQCLDPVEGFGSAYIAEVPDLVGVDQTVGQTRRHPVMGVGDNGDSGHRSGLNNSTGDLANERHPTRL